MKKIFVYIFTFVFIVGGCEIMDEKKNNSDIKPNETLPNTAAFQDPFTREFMVSPEEVEEGFFLFKSGTDSFKMSFPVNAKISKTYYFKEEKKREEIQIYGTHPKNNTQYNFHLTYYDQVNPSSIDFYLDLTSSYNKYDGEYEKYSINDNTVYYAEMVIEFSEFHNGKVLCYFGFIKSDSSNQAIIYSHSAICVRGDSNCVLDEIKEREFAKKIMHSIKFD